MTASRAIRAELLVNCWPSVSKSRVLGLVGVLPVDGVHLVKAASRLVQSRAFIWGSNVHMLVAAEATPWTRPVHRREDRCTDDVVVHRVFN